MFLELAQDEVLFTCIYDTNSEATLRQAKPTTSEIKTPDVQWVLRFVLRPDGTASLIGNLGSVPVEPITGDGTITFQELTGAGNITLTTIRYGDGPPMISSHSRHMWIIDSMVVSQYYGTCTGQ